jgi:uncharacterized repeat protein (TIGR03803 family)
VLYTRCRSEFKKESSLMAFGRLVIAAAVTIVLTTAVSAATGPKILHNFTGGSDGELPIWYGNLVFDSKGNLYGTASGGGSSACGGGCGMVFELSPSTSGWQKTTLYNFVGGSNDGGQPDSGVVFDKAGNLYGTTVQGGAGCGTVFKLSPASGGRWDETMIHSFSGTGGNDGCEPIAGVIVDKDGNVFGTVPNGGANGDGMVFELTNSGGVWRETVLHNFGFGIDDGGSPWSALVMDSTGNLYGTTQMGGASGVGTVFKLSQLGGVWSENVIYSFGFSGGYYPSSAVVFDKAGNLYGTASYGGSGTVCSPSCGVVYELKHSTNGWSERVVYNFLGGTDGSYPVAGVTIAGGGLYGTTSFGGGGPCSINGLTGCGTIFSLKQSSGKWAERVLRLNGTDGANPQAGLVANKNGVIFGATLYGGSGSCSGNLPGCGVVFAIVP